MSTDEVNIPARREDIRWMAETGESLTGAAQRLGLTHTALDKFCRRQGLYDELHRMLARDPRDHNKPLPTRWAS